MSQKCSRPGCDALARPTSPTCSKNCTDFLSRSKKKAPTPKVEAGADLKGFKLQEADLTEADLQRANLRGFKLQRANLQGANLTDANLTEAIVQDADFRGSNLKSDDRMIGIHL